MGEPEFTLSATQRLKKPADFQRVYKSKQWGGSAHFTFNVLAANESQLGVTVSKKVSKLAVVRNRIKRQVREFYRTHQHDLNSAHLVITAKPSCREASDEDRYASLDELWGKVIKWQRWNAHQQASL